MHSITSRIAIICAAAAVLTVMPHSVQISKQTGITVATDQAQARVGRPATPMSAAGVARRTTRRAVVGGAAAGTAAGVTVGAAVAHPACARVRVNGAWVCR